MADILHEVTIAAPPDTIYKAITEQNGLRSWWTQQATAKPQVGTVSEFGFYGGQVLMQLEVTDLTPSQHAEWKSISGVPDWQGTRVTWDLTPVENGTKLLFGHRNFASTDGSYAMTNFNWGWYLISLKRYAETGTGSPHTGEPNT